MILWLDAHVSPKLYRWIQREWRIDAVHVRDLGLRETEDPKIFDKARLAEAVVLTKDDELRHPCGTTRSTTTGDLAHLRKRVERAPEEDSLRRTAGGARDDSTGRTGG